MDDNYANINVEASKMSCNVIHVEDAIIEEIFHDNRTSYVTISYGEKICKKYLTLFGNYCIK